MGWKQSFHMVLSPATLAKDTPLSSCVGHPYRKGYTFFLIVSVDTLGKCYMPVCELGSTSFSVVPATSPSFPSCLRHSRHLSVTTVSLSYIPFIIVYHRLSVFRLSSIPSLQIYSAPVMFQASFLRFVAALSYFNIFTFLWLDNKFIVFVIL